MPRSVEEIIKELEHLSVRQTIALRELTEATAAKEEPRNEQDDEWEFPIGR